MLVLIPVIGPVVALLLGITLIGFGTNPALTPFLAVLLAALF